MLTTLRIKNLALVTDLTVEFQPGYNVITGETGAGKSMLIGALNLVLGQRADRGLIRSGADSCSVEAVFNVDSLKKTVASFLEENGLEKCEDNALLLNRTFSASGTNRQFINGSPATLGVLSSLGELLVDIHGPHEHQSLLHPARQLAILDAFGKLEADRDAFSALVRQRLDLESQKAGLIIDERTYAQQLDLLRFQVDEIRSARLDPDEEKQVELDYNRASNAAKLLQLGQSALEILSEQDASLLNQAGSIGRSISELHRLDPAAADIQNAHEQVIVSLRELQDSLSHYVDKVELEPATLQRLEERLNLLHSLKRKYGSSLNDVIQFGEEAARKLQQLEQREGELARLDSELNQLGTAIWKQGKALSRKRRDLVQRLSKAAMKQLSDLGFKQSRFDIAITTLSEDDCGSRREMPGHSPKFGLTGLDTAEFQFAPNPGEPSKPLRAIASSGEMARVMLALKTVLAAEDEVPVLVFDEVDANVGGETAAVVGDKMRQIARSRQVLCITHLPQVAAPANVHLLASKQVREGRTTSEISLLTRKDRVTELARMLGGQSDAARKHAEELLK